MRTLAIFIMLYPVLSLGLTDVFHPSPDDGEMVAFNGGWRWTAKSSATSTYDPYDNAVWQAISTGWTDNIGTNDLSATGALLTSPTNSMRAIGVFTLDYADAGSATELLQDVFTHAAWVRLPSLEAASGAYQTIFTTVNHGATTYGSILVYHEADNVTRLYVDEDGVGDWKIGNGPNMTAAMWQYLVGVFDGTNITVYLDGVPGTPVACNGITYSATSELRIGKYGDSATTALYGDLSDAVIYDVALSSATINSNMAYTAWGGGTNGQGSTQYLYNDPDNQASNCIVCYSFDTDQDLVQNWAQQVSHADNGDRSASGTTWTADGTNTWLDFDGSTGYVDSADIGTVKTISFWINPDDVTDRKIINIDGTDQIELNASSNIVATSFPAATIYTNGVAGSGPLKTGVWTHVAVVDSTGVAASTFEIGRVGASYYDGAIDDVYAFSTELTAGQIVNLTANGSHYAP